MLFQEIHLQTVPGFFIGEHIISFEFLIKGGPNIVEIVAPEVIKICIANDLLQKILWTLWDLCSHDHPTNVVDLIPRKIILG